MKHLNRVIAAAVALCAAFGAAAYAADDAECPADIQWLQAIGFMKGDADGDLKLGEKITRAEAAALMLRARGESASDGSGGFSDTNGHWAEKYIIRAAELKIINGYPDGSFKPDDTVLYEEMLKMLLSALGTGGDLKYPDGVTALAEAAGFCDGVTAKTGDEISRADAARMFLNAFDSNVSGTDKTLLEIYLEAAENKDGDISFRFDDGSAEEAVPEADEIISGALTESVAADTAEIMEMTPTAAGGSGGGSASYDAPSYEASSETFTDGAYKGTRPAPSGQNRPAPEAGQLTAGRWDDNDNRDFWLKLMEDHNYGTYSGRWGIPSARCAVTVTDENGNPAWDVPVTLADGQGNAVWISRTDKDGKAYMFTDPQSYSAEETLSLTAKSPDGGVSDAVYITTETESAELKLAAAPSPEALDIMLTVDTTGSMSDELEYLSAELKDVVSSIGIPARVSCNFYRDFGDAYIVRPFPFDEDIDENVKRISRQRAMGGGDYEEAVDLALIDGVTRHEWSESAKARLMFLVLDAPAHYNHTTTANIRAATAAASEKGIRIIPVAASGANKSTEFFLRTIAAATNGTYLFLTDDSGIGNSHIEPTIGDYTPEYLNNLMISVIKEYAGAE